MVAQREYRAMFAFSSSCLCLQWYTHSVAVLEATSTYVQKIVNHGASSQDETAIFSVPRSLLQVVENFWTNSAQEERIMQAFADYNTARNCYGRTKLFKSTDVPVRSGGIVQGLEKGQRRKKCRLSWPGARYWRATENDFLWYAWLGGCDDLYLVWSYGSVSIWAWRYSQQTAVRTMVTVGEAWGDKVKVKTQSFTLVWKQHTCQEVLYICWI